MVNRRFYANFAAGFESVIGGLVEKNLPGCAIASVSGGMVLFDSASPCERVAAIPFFNNSFLVLREWESNSIDFPALIKGAAGTKFGSLAKEPLDAARAKTFRVRYSRQNQFCPVDKAFMAKAEQSIAAQTGLTPDRLTPDAEFWFIIRSERLSFFALCLTKKQSTEKYLEKGELRPEIATLLAALAGANSNDRVICDPFAGHGALPECLAELCPSSRILVSDLSADLSKGLTARFSSRPNVTVRQCDALKLGHIESRSVDLVLTDPPWGFWDGDAYSGEKSVSFLYRGMLAEFERILRAGGRACVLTGAKAEFEEAVRASTSFAWCADESGFRTDVLVNGKKSAAFRLTAR